MAWFRDSELPTELQGKKPEEIVAAVKAAEALQAKVTELESTGATRGNELNDTRQRLEAADAEVVRLKALVPPDKPERNDEPANVFTDPERFVADQTEATRRMAIQSGILTAQMSFKQSLGQRDLKIFNKYQKEVEQAINGYQLEQRAIPQNWQLAFLLVKGLHEQDIAKFESTASDFFSETSSHGSDMPPNPPEDKLSTEEAEACRVMHWDPKGYLARKKEMRTAQGANGQGHIILGMPERSRP